MVTSGERFLETFVDELAANDGFQLEETTEDNHVEHLSDTLLGSLLGSGNLVDVDVATSRLMSDTVGVVNKQAAGLYALLKLVERLLVENNSGVKFADDWR